MRRVVVTGLGLVSPLGNDVATSWNALLDGACGIDRITLFDVENYGCQIGGEVKNFDAAQYLPATLTALSLSGARPAWKRWTTRGLSSSRAIPPLNAQASF